MTTPDLVDQALADMRAGRRVLIVTPTNDAAASMRDQFSARLAAGESVRSTGGHCYRVTTQGGGWIEFRSYISIRNGGVRGMTLDRIYVDHTELHRELMPALVTARDGGKIVHYTGRSLAEDIGPDLDLIIF